MPRALTLLALLALASGCARHGEARTAEVHGADGGRYYALVFHFLTAADDYDRASYVHDGDEFREEMGLLRRAPARRVGPRRCRGGGVGRRGDGGGPCELRGRDGGRCQGGAAEG